MSEPTSRASLTAGFLPWWPANPYQLLLKRALVERGVRVIGDPPLSLPRILLGRDGLDVVHVHWPHGTYKTLPRMLYMALVLLLYRLLRNNIVWTVHELTAYESRHPRRDAWFRGLVMRLSRQLIVHGEHTRRVVRGELRYPRQVQVAHHPPYTGWYKDEMTPAQARKTLGLGAGDRVLLYFGYVKPYKGVEDLLRAFRGLPGEDLRLLVVGRPLDDAIRGEVEALAAQDARVHARLTYVPEDDIQLYFRACDLVVFPFRETQTSGSLMLALTFGRPVVAPAMATLTEYVDDSVGVMYDPSAPDALAGALARAVAAPLPAMAAAAQRRAAALDWGAMADVHLRVYHAICPPRP